MEKYLLHMKLMNNTLNLTDLYESHLFGLRFLGICCCSLSNQNLNITTAMYEKNKEKKKTQTNNKPK